jgi:transposase
MTEQQLLRQAKRRLAILQHAEEVTGNVSRTCRYYGISRQCFYRWQRRYEAEGLEVLRDRSSRPHFSPLATHTDIVGKIVYLRQHYHFGPRKISMYLARYHDITISNSGVWRILKRLELNRLPASQRYKTHDRRWKRYEKPLPGHQVQIDVKFIEPVAGAKAKKYYQTARWRCGLRASRPVGHPRRPGADTRSAGTDHRRAQPQHARPTRRRQRGSSFTGHARPGRPRSRRTARDSSILTVPADL